MTRDPENASGLRRPASVRMADHPPGAADTSRNADAFQPDWWLKGLFELTRSAGTERHSIPGRLCKRRKGHWKWRASGRPDVRPRPLGRHARLPDGRLRAGGVVISHSLLCHVALFDIPFHRTLFGGVVKSEGVFVMTPLRQRMMEDLQIRNYATTTVKAYIRGVADFAKHFGKSPDQLGAEQIREYQLFLIKEKEIALPTYIQIVSGLRFLIPTRCTVKSPSSVSPSRGTRESCRSL